MKLRLVLGVLVILVSALAPVGLAGDGAAGCKYMCGSPPPPPPPPHVVVGAASVICDGMIYRLSGTIDGQAADGVTPATLPGATKGTINVTVTRGDTSFRTTVTVNGDCPSLIG